MELQALSVSANVRSTSASWRIQVSACLLIVGWGLAACSAPMIMEGSPIDAVADGIGWSCLLLGVAIRFWSIWHIAGRKSRAIVETGPYALCRNPLYLGTMLIGTSEAAFLKSGWFLLSFVSLILFYVMTVIPGEERKLYSRFGSDFQDYCERVPRWWPRFRRQCLAPVSVRDRRAIAAELRCLLCWTLLPMLGETTCYLRVQPWWPHLVPGF